MVERQRNLPQLEAKERELFYTVPDAIILCGGSGKRLGLTDRPKPMADVNGKAIFEYQIQEMQEGAGINHVVFASGHLGNVLANYVGNGEQYNLKASISHEQTPLGRGGAIKKAMKELSSNWNHVVVTNGDNLWKVNFQEMIKKHIENSAIATIALVQPMDQFGKVEADKQGRITKFGEKERRQDWINAGVYILSREIEPLLPEVGDHETTTFQELPPSRFFAYYSSEFWKNIDTPKDLEEARSEAVLHF